MIFDEFRNFQRYGAVAPEAWRLIAEFLNRIDEKTEIGRYELDGDRVYATVQHYATHPADTSKLEYHRRYADIQLLLSGRETIYVRPLNGLIETMPYDEKLDVGFYELNSDGAVSLPLSAGNFALFLPEEGHMPGVGVPDREVIKVVVKIDVSLLK